MIELFLCLAVYSGRVYSDLYTMEKKRRDCLRHDIEYDQWNGNEYGLNLKESLALSSICKPYRITCCIMYYVGG